MLFIIVPNKRANGEEYNELLFEPYSEELGKDLLNELERKHLEDSISSFDQEFSLLHEHKSSKPKKRTINLIHEQMLARKERIEQLHQLTITENK